MKKIVCLIGIFMLVFSLNAFADEKKDSGSTSVGFLGIEAEAGNATGSFGFAETPWWSADGFAVGGGLAGGHSEGGAFGGVYNGSIEGEINTVGGGLSKTETIKDISPSEHRVGTLTQNQASTHGKIKVKADVGDGFGAGAVLGGFHGAAGQVSGNVSHMHLGWAFDSEGHTGGIAGQGSAGYIAGSAGALVAGYSVDEGYTGRDCNDKGKCTGWFVKTNGENAGTVRYFDGKKPRDENPNWEYLGAEKVKPRDLKAGAGAKAGIDMTGFSYSESYRAIDKFEGGKTESMGTFVGAGTDVKSYGNDWEWKVNEGCGIACSNASVDGGWIAAGGAATRTVQGGDGLGHARAGAVGGYFGAGELGTNFNGSAIGHSQTSITTIDGFNGSINGASAGMKVTAQGGGYNAD